MSKNTGRLRQCRADTAAWDAVKKQVAEHMKDEYKLVQSVAVLRRAAWLEPRTRLVCDDSKTKR